MNLLSQLDDFWREGLQTPVIDPRAFQSKYTKMLHSMQSQVAHLPQGDQDILFKQLVDRNNEYMAIARRNREELKARLGVAGPSHQPNHLAQAAVETAVRATIWQSIAALFRAFR